MPTQDLVLLQQQGRHISLFSKSLVFLCRVLSCLPPPALSFGIPGEVLVWNLWAVLELLK